MLPVCPRGFPPRKWIHYIPFLFVHPHSPVGVEMSPIKGLGRESNLGLLFLSTLIKIPILLN